MKKTNDGGYRVTPLIAVATASILLAACATVPVEPLGAAAARNNLTQLQSDPNLATRAPQAVAEADAAVRVAEQPEEDKDLAAYRVYMADRKVEVARAQAQTRFAEDQRALISAQREQARLEARTREANVAEGKVAQARAEDAEQKVAAQQARSDADTAQQAAAAANQQTAAANQQAAAANQQAAAAGQQAAELQLQVDALQAKPTDRGLVLTLSGVLFANGNADLSPSAGGGNLDKLVAFLNKYPDRTVVIEGYTDNRGNSDYNLGLSQRRADTVRGYLTSQGISASRVSSTGKGASDPVAGNDTASGRQQNRRVEVIISDPSTTSR